MTAAVKPLSAPFENSGGPSSCPEPRPDPLIFKREDWVDFRTLDGLAKKAGVSQGDLGELALKELWDNALDAAPTAAWGGTDDGFWVDDDGPGLPGTDEEIAALFSVRRPLTSSKLLRLPTRGALGNGLRVVTGLALATGGTITIFTRGRGLILTPRFHDGGTDLQPIGGDETQGTRIKLQGVRNRPTGKWLTDVPQGIPYLGRSSPYWYDSESFFELVNAAGRTPVRALLAELEGLSGAKAGRLAGDFRGRVCESLTQAEADLLLDRARHASKPVKASRLGLAWQDGKAYARSTDEFSTLSARGFSGNIPFVVEVLVEPAKDPEIVLTMNRTLLPGDIELYRFGSEALSTVTGCGLNFEVKAGQRRVWKVRANILTPFYPKTSDGKHPDLALFGDCLQETIEKAIRKARRAFPPPVGSPRDDEDESEEPSETIEAQVLEHLDAAISRVSGEGKHRYAQRQLFYAIREMTGGDDGPLPPKRWNYFCTIISREEQRRGGDLPGMFRDARGTVYHPHLAESLPLGTLSVEAYHRPIWTFNKILFIEKEGFFQILKDMRWPERHDCALITSKGQGTRAAKDLLDLLGDSDEPVTVYLIHDADAAGTIIYQALQEATIARPRRRVEIVNLGLEPAEALAMGLAPESVATGERARPVARYVTKRWREWLQSKRVELNAMTTPQFLAWLDKKFAKTRKLIPPSGVLRQRLEDKVRANIQDAVEEEIRDKVEEMVDERLESVRPLFDALPDLTSAVSKAFKSDRTQPWTQPVDVLAAEVAREAET